MEGVTSTGEIGGWASEHSLVANVKDKGLVILTGCGHPRIVNIVRRAQQVSGVSRVHAIIGGFHISVREALEAANLLGKIGAELVSPCHYTSENVKKVMSDKLGTRCVKNGSGKIFSID
jgi:7,8-dihydropterin-6-yl-methyl-4-(beta-D-ribofuranosyl)aminobenzene 5'-phosphate synthase